ncbi:hypothetical protein F5Y16DRAFT_396700 [Xylariaceae sp. FL0255]|nr:hypothetical protein F5Y16DRAFT_396700 [Xylariaceae sp. FL0255]
MGRLEPLVSLALGRSPYDDEVVEGEGDDDPRQPPRQYNEQGRVTNPETRRINRELIRAHNEVMHVIGVAEPDNAARNTLEMDAARMRDKWETTTGKRLRQAGCALFNVGLRGIYGIRQRLLVYREPTTLPFLQMLLRERQLHSLPQLLLAGVPAALSARSFEWCQVKYSFVKRSTILRALIGWIRFHLQVYIAMQRLELIPASRWFPGIDFYVPFSSASPFTAPPPLSSWSAQGLSEWLGKLAINLLPYAGYYLVGRLRERVGRWLWHKIRKHIPQPWPIIGFGLPPPLTTPHRQSIPESPTLGAADREIRHPQPTDVDIPEPLPMNGEGNGDYVPVGAFRRQGTFSSRGGGDDGATDDEDSEMVNPTLISFDVDTSESTEAPTGVWSAELRPSFGSDSRSQMREPPRYTVNALTSLPSLLAADLYASTLTVFLLTPLDMLALRAMARSFSLKFGLPLAALCGANFTDGISTRMILNLVSTDMLAFIMSSELWAGFTLFAQQCHYSDEEWRQHQAEINKAKELEEAEEDDDTPL